MAREAGAVKVYFASCAPPLVYPHIVCSFPTILFHVTNTVQYGIDLASPQEMIAHEKVSADSPHSNIVNPLGLPKWKQLDDDS
jgi:amidophosphoribosyltransferase